MQINMYFRIFSFFWPSITMYNEKEICNIKQRCWHHLINANELLFKATNYDWIWQYINAK